MYRPVLLPLAAKLMELSINFAGAAFRAAEAPGSAPMITMEPVTAGDHVPFVVSAMLKGGVSCGPSVQCGSGMTIALNELNCAVVIADHEVLSFTVTA